MTNDQPLSTYPLFLLINQLERLFISNNFYFLLNINYPFLMIECYKSVPFDGGKVHVLGNDDSSIWLFKYSAF